MRFQDCGVCGIGDDLGDFEVRGVLDGVDNCDVSGVHYGHNDFDYCSVFDGLDD
jgi:hypothetical protein